MKYVHGYDPWESNRFQDKASSLVQLLHSDTTSPAGSKILEAGCGVGAETISIAKNSPHARYISVDISQKSVIVGGTTYRKIN